MRQHAFTLRMRLISLPHDLDNLKLSPLEQRKRLVPVQYHNIIFTHACSSPFSSHRRAIAPKCVATQLSE